jgi:putative phosphonate metabolism protein
VPQYKRYAIYFAPRPDEPLHAFGVDWFGADPETGRDAPDAARPLPGVSAAAHWALIASARRYALHGTLKPPFRLAAGTTAKDLESAVARLAADLAPIDLGPVDVMELGRFLALCPVDAPESLSTLAARCVSDLDAFRAPPDEAELARRRKAGLTAAHEANLLRWGYPYVMDAFRFHVTLTGQIPDDTRSDIANRLRERLGPILSEPLMLRDLCLFAEIGDGSPFRLVSRHPLSG